MVEHMADIAEVEISPAPLEQLAQFLAPERRERLRTTAVHAHAMLAGRTIWNINSTASGGGVAEMLATLLAYVRGAGVQTRWAVLHADPAFFAITKRLHNAVHGSRGDGGPLGPAERAHYESVLAGNLADLAPHVRQDDIVLLHDPQTAGLVDGLKALDAHVIWRCHIGADGASERSDAGWEFLRPYAEPADAFIFSRLKYAPPWVPRERLRVIPPSVDPFAVKNRDLEPDDVTRVLRLAGLAGPGGTKTDETPFPFAGRDGRPRVVRRHTLLGDAVPPPPDARWVVQVSRWDRLKDMAGVMTAFADHVAPANPDAHLLLVGPAVAGVADDPEGAAVLAECERQHGGLPTDLRSRVHLVRVPMDDLHENALIVNAIQRRADVVVQKSLAEGFGLTVTEAMWKARPVVASAVGGIPDQIVDGRDGLLVDPLDLPAVGKAVRRVLENDPLGRELGAHAQERVRTDFLGDRHLTQYVDLFGQLLGAT